MIVWLLCYRDFQVPTGKSSTIAQIPCLSAFHLGCMLHIASTPNPVLCVPLYDLVYVIVIVLKVWKFLFIHIVRHYRSHMNSHYYSCTMLFTLVYLYSTHHLSSECHMTWSIILNGLRTSIMIDNIMEWVQFVGELPVQCSLFQFICIPHIASRLRAAWRVSLCASRLHVMRTWVVFFCQ